MMFGGVIRPATRGARLEHMDENCLNGFSSHIVRDGSFVGVVGENEAVVMAAVKKLRSACRWKEAALLPDEDNLAAFLKSGPHETISVESDQLPAPTPTDLHLRATYSRPFLAHASMAPSCAVAQWNDSEHITVWSHSQGIFRLRAAIADTLGLAHGRSSSAMSRTQAVTATTGRTTRRSTRSCWRAMYPVVPCRCCGPAATS